MATHPALGARNRSSFVASTYNQAQLEDSKRAIQQRYPSFAKQLFAFLERDESTICWANNWSNQLSALRVSPSNAIKNQFGIVGEIPILIATYDGKTSLQPRALRHFNTSKELRSGDSADKDIAILVASDRAAGRFTKDRRRFAYPILTIYAEDLATNCYSNRSLRSEIAALMRSANHFDYSNEIRQPADFFGRTDDVEALARLASEGQSVGIFGLRRAGKTSLMYRVREELDRRGIASIYVQLNTLVDATGLREELVRATAKTLQSKKGRVPGNSEMLNHDFTIRSCESTARRWIYEMDALLDQIDADMVVMLDETDRANEESIDIGGASSDERRSMHQVLQQLRGLIQIRNERGKRNLSFLAAGVAASIFTNAIRFGKDNQLFGFASARPLGPMSREEMRTMVRVLGKRSGLKFDAHNIFDSLLDEYGGHPHLTRQACARVAESVQAKPDTDVPYRVRLDDLESVYSATAENSPLYATAQTFRSFELWYPKEAAAVREAIEHGQPAEIALITHAIDFGICDGEGNVRQRALVRALSRGVG